MDPNAIIAPSPPRWKLSCRSPSRQVAWELEPSVQGLNMSYVASRNAKATCQLRLPSALHRNVCAPAPVIQVWGMTTCRVACTVYTAACLAELRQLFTSQDSPRTPRTLRSPLLPLAGWTLLLFPNPRNINSSSPELQQRSLQRTATLAAP